MSIRFFSFLITASMLMFLADNVHAAPGQGRKESVFAKYKPQSNSTHYTIPSNFTKIGNSAFRHCKLESITIPFGVTHIDDWAFANCNNLKSITIPASVRQIGKYAFGRCRNLEKVIISSKNIKIGSSCFFSCTKLSSISFPAKGNIIISDGAFSGCGLKMLALPESIKVLERAAFFGSDLEELTVSGSIDTVNGFSGCSKLKKVTLSEGVRVIGDNSFQRCRNLQEIILPSTLEVIGENAFGGNMNLKQITLPEGLKMIKKEALSSTMISEINLPSSVEKLGLRALRGKVCVSPENINFKTDKYGAVISSSGELVHFPFDEINSYTIPENVTVISGMISAREVNIHAGVKKIYPRALVKVNKINVSSDNPNLKLDKHGVLFDSNGVLLAAGALSQQEYNVPVGTSAISEYAFVRCYGVQTVKVPEGVKIIEERAFASSPVSTVILPDSIEEIREQAFLSSKLNRIKMPSGKVYIASRAFEYCQQLDDIELHDNMCFANIATAFSGSKCKKKLPKKYPAMFKRSFKMRQQYQEYCKNKNAEQ